MDGLMQRVRLWNERMNDLPRKLFLILVVLLACLLVIAALPLCLPFVLALAFSALMGPLVRLLRRGLTRLGVGRRALLSVLPTLLSLLIVLGAIGFLTAVLARRLFAEALDLAKSLPDMLAWLNSTLDDWLLQLTAAYSDVIPGNFVAMIDQAIDSLSVSLVTLVTDLSRRAASGAFATAFSLPRGLLFVVLTIMGTYRMSSDRERIMTYMERTLPRRTLQSGTVIKRGIMRALFGQVRSQMLVSLVVMLVVIAGLLLLGIPYALLIGLAIGLADVLPVIGAGTFLIPWGLFNLLLGDYRLAAGLLVLYVAVVVTRQIVEPRIVGQNLGLYPLVTMMSMYAGYVLFGFLGLLAGPIVANICKVVLEADRAGRMAPLENA